MAVDFSYYLFVVLEVSLKKWNSLNRGFIYIKMKVNDMPENADAYSDDYQLPKESLYTFEEALAKVGGGFNRYQIACFLYFGMQWWMANWVLMSPVYLFVNPQVNCGANQTCQNSCKGQDPFGSADCQKFICDTLLPQDRGPYLSGSSLIMEYDPPLICEEKGTASLLQSLVYMGSLVGFFLFSFVADNYGRKVGLGTSWLMATLGSMLLGTSFNIEMVGAGMFLCGFGVNPAITIHYSYINEHSQGKFREYQNAGVQVFFGVAEMVLVGIAYSYPYWRTLALYWIAIPILVLNIPILFILESPKYLYPKNKMKAVALLNKIARINRKPTILNQQVKDCKRNQFNQQRIFTLVDLLTYKSLRGMFLCGFMIFLTMQLVFYGINFAMQQIGLNLYINAIVVAFFETLSYSVCDFLIPILPRRKTIFYGFFGSCVVCCLYVLLNKPGDCGDVCAVLIIQVALIGLIRFSITTVWTFAYVHLSELFPTVVRSLALGLISAGGTIGSVSSAFVGNFSQDLGLNPLLSLGIVGAVGSLFVLPLRETFKESLHDEIEEDIEANRTTYRISSDTVDLNYKTA